MLASALCIPRSNVICPLCTGIPNANTAAIGKISHVFLMIQDPFL